MDDFQIAKNKPIKILIYFKIGIFFNFSVKIKYFGGIKNKLKKCLIYIDVIYIFVVNSILSKWGFSINFGVKINFLAQRLIQKT